MTLAIEQLKPTPERLDAAVRWLETRKSQRIPRAEYDELSKIYWLLRDLHSQQASHEALVAALRKADEAIQRGQACRSEAEFARWMHESQSARPSAELLALASSEVRERRGEELT